MTTITDRTVLSTMVPAAHRHGPGNAAAFATLVRRRLSLSARTPREIMIPLMTPVFFALVIAPALASIGPRIRGLDYMSFAAIGTAGLLIPLNCLFAAIGVIVDRDSGARRDLLAAPIARPVLVLANLAAAAAITALQLTVLIIAAIARGADLSTSASGVAWFAGAAALLTIGMYGVAESLANRIRTVEEFAGAVPGLAVVPFFFAGSLYPITALPWALTCFGRILPLTHALAVMRYGLLGSTSGLDDIWGMGNATAMAALSLSVIAAFAAALTVIAIRVFSRSAVQ
jgi:ABC-2 type transport system permease protein